MKLIIYYDNPSKASDMYLKWLKKDCEKQGVDYAVVNDKRGLKLEILSNKWYVRVLPMLPLKDKSIMTFLKSHPSLDIDNVAKTNFYTSCTATGIYNHIVDKFPDRGASISVIGRGVVGKELIDMLIDYGYTVMEFNSKSSYACMKYLCSEFSDVVVGLANNEVLDADDCEEINSHGSRSALLIDGGNCFDTNTKLRCGKWTRQEMIRRLLEND